MGYVEREADKYLYLFIHIPKCAGGTSSNHIQWKYKNNANLDPDSKDRRAVLDGLNEQEIEQAQAAFKINPYLMRRSWIYKYIQTLSEEQRETIRCIHGHAVPYGFMNTLSALPVILHFCASQPRVLFLFIITCLLCASRLSV